MRSRAQWSHGGWDTRCSVCYSNNSTFVDKDSASKRAICSRCIERGFMGVGEGVTEPGEVRERVYKYAMFMRKKNERAINLLKYGPMPDDYT